jgi:hypothetical protein
VISFFAKKARGQMARYIIEGEINDVAALKRFRVSAATATTRKNPAPGSWCLPVTSRRRLRRGTACTGGPGIRLRHGDTRHQVIVIGAGMSGLCMGIKLRERGIEDFLILEKSPGVGGTWHDNTYPGACCDVPSVLYSYSFAPNPDWSRKFSPHNEIRPILQRCADRFGLRRTCAWTTTVSARGLGGKRGSLAS